MSFQELLLMRLLLAFIFGLRTLLRFQFIFKHQNKEIYNRFDSTYFDFAVPFELVFVFLIIYLTRYRSGEMLLMMLVHLLLTLFVFTLVMLILTPLLRKQISASGCAALWGLQSVAAFYCFLTVIIKDWSELTLYPLVTIRLSASIVWIVLGVWLAGFIFVLGWKILSHFRFRRTLLRNAEPFSEREITLFLEARDQLFVREAFVELQQKLQLYRSPATDTPLSIGLFQKTTCFVIPQRNYSDEELRLIFRHEIIHLLHDDNRLKFSLTFLCAAGWFLPSLWTGMGKASEELELCCDELATGYMKEEERRQYAGLLLNTAGPAKGFTTCLSASASGLKYRLERVLHPQKHSNGKITAVLLTIMIVFLFGTVGFSIKAGTVGSEILSADGGGWTFSELVDFTDPSHKGSIITESMADWLFALELDRRPEDAKQAWTYPNDALRLVLKRSDGQTMILMLSDDTLDCYLPVEDTAIRYYLEEKADLNQLRCLAETGS